MVIKDLNCEKKLPSGIYPRVDAYSMIFEHVCFDDLFRYFHFKYDFEKLFDTGFTTSIFFGVSFCIVVGKGVKFYVPAYVMKSLQNTGLSCEEISRHKFDKIEVVAQGEGCSFLYNHFASLNPAQNFLDFVRTDPSSHFLSLGGTCHLTRCDFAFDLVGYKSDFLDNVVDYVLTSYSEGLERLPIYKKTGGISSKLVVGSGTKMLYLGKDRKILRIYDKKAQNCIDGQWKPNTALYGTDCSSWIRIELQLRREYSPRVAYGEGDIYSIFKYIYHNYRFADYTTSKNKRVPAAFWDELLDWNDHSIIQNANCVAYVDMLQTVVSYPARSAGQAYTFMFFGGKSRLEVERREAWFRLIRDRDTVEGYNQYRYKMDQLKILAKGQPLDQALPYFKWENGIPICTCDYTYQDYMIWHANNPSPYQHVLLKGTELQSSYPLDVLVGDSDDLISNVQSIVKDDFKMPDDLTPLDPAVEVLARLKCMLDVSSDKSKKGVGK